MSRPQPKGEFPIAGMAVEGSADATLADIRQPEVALAVWRRPLDEAVSTWLDALSPESLPHRRFVCDRRTAPDVVEAACAEMPAGPERDALVEDVASLIERFSAILIAPRLRVRLEAIEGDACRRFHQDAVSARMLCTYRGPATEWGHAERGAEPEAIHSLRRGDVGILKGSRWRGAPEHRIVHRSPPIAGTGLARLLLVVDPADASDDEDWVTHLRLRRPE